MNENKLIDIINFYQRSVETIFKRYKEHLLFVDCFYRLVKQERQTLPYHINIIDELHINENAHSRILYKLLQFTDTKGEYEILSSLVHYMQEKSHADSFDIIQVKSPIITQEESRIDLWVRDVDYAIIFENKIYNACDQDNQLSRYIEATISKGYDVNRIFVVYLSSSGQKPDDQSWGGYKGPFRDRYINLSFRDDILIWLLNDIIPNLRKKDYFLQSALDQYVDYLQGLYYKRNYENKMIMNLDNFIIEHFNLDSLHNDAEKAGVLQEKINEMSEVLEKMKSLCNSYRQSIFLGWKEKTKTLFPELNPNEYNTYTDVSFVDFDGRKVYVYISESGNGMYCQVEYDKQLPKELRTIEGSSILSLSDILPSKAWHCVWKWIPNNDYDGAYALFCETVRRCKELFKMT